MHENNDNINEEDYFGLEQVTLKITTSGDEYEFSFNGTVAVFGIER